MAHENELEMEPSEVLALTQAIGYGVLATLEEDAAPMVETVRCEVEDGQVCLTLPLDSRSHFNIERDPRVCVVLENAERFFYRVESATIHGVAKLVEEDKARGLARYALALDDVVSFDFSRIKVKH